MAAISVFTRGRSSFKKNKKLLVMEDVNVLFNEALNTFYFMVIWRRTIQIVREEPAAATWATLSD